MYNAYGMPRPPEPEAEVAHVFKVQRLTCEKCVERISKKMASIGVGAEKLAFNTSEALVQIMAPESREADLVSALAGCGSPIIENRTKPKF